MIPVSRPDFGPAETAAVAAVLASHWVGMGPQTAAFEAALAKCLAVRHVIATASCTSALHLSLTALERDKREEIIVPSLTFAATIQAIILAGYSPVFAEVHPETLTLDCDDAARQINRRTRAILPVHFAGYPCDSERLRQLAETTGIDVISDSAHAFGTTFHGTPLGQLETATCFSFSSNKNISTGEGGAIATNSDALADRLKQLRFLGISQHSWERRVNDRPWEYTVTGPGFRYHMSDINAAIGLAQLERLNGFAKKRRKLAETYDVRLAGLPGILPVERDLEHTIPHLYVLRVTHGFRDGLYARLRANGISCGVHYVPNHRQPAFRKFARPLPVTEALAEQVISLPLHTKLEAAQVEHISTLVRDFLREMHPVTRRRPARTAQRISA